MKNMRYYAITLLKHRRYFTAGKGGKVFMQFQGRFETLKMIEQGNRVYCSTDSCEGRLLIYLIRKKEEIPKEQLMTWLKELCIQLDGYHKFRHRAYQYVNPYAVVITDSQEIKLLDLESETNESVLIYLQKSIIRESFGKTSGIRRTRIPTDYYSFGKTLQFIMSQGNIFPEISIIESYLFSKIIRKCLEESVENQYKNIKEVQNQIPKIKKKKVQKRKDARDCGGP